MGGNSSINGGVMAIAGSDVQKQKGIKDSADRLMADMLKAGLGLNHVDLAKIVATESVKTYEWLKSELKVEFQAKPPLIQMGGHSVPRSRIIQGNTGAGIVNKELAKLKEMGVPVKKRVCLTALIQDDTGRIVGATVREGYSFPDANSGTVKNIKAKKGVIMATGGFSRDMFLRTAQDPRLVASVDSTNQPGATGEGLMSMMGCGATPVQLSWIQLGPWASPEEKGFGMAPHFSTQAFLYGILVNPKTGKRFVNELADRKTRADAILATDNICVVFATAEKMKDGGVVDALLPRMLKKGVAKKYETLGELAAAYKIPADALKAEVAKYNGFLKAGHDDEFGKPFPKDAAPIESGPFLAVRLWPKVHHTMGGALINEKAQVVGLDDKPIPGLYAAGEVTGGIHGACRLGSVATLECLVFGRRAGRNAAKSA
jgi:flavocytochrome c